MDTLVIQVPGSSGGRQVVVVDQIYGAQLNGVPESAAAAARNLKIYALPATAVAWSSVATLTALPSSPGEPHVLLLVSATHEGHLVLWEWNLAAATLTALEGALPLGLDDNVPRDAGTDDWGVDLRLGLHPQRYEEGWYVLVAATNGAESAVVWLDVAARQCRTHVRLPSPLGAILPIRSTEGTLAVAVATKGDGSTGETHVSTTTAAWTQLQVHQVVAEETLGLRVLSQPHLVFTIPLVEAVLHTVSLTPSLDAEAYAFTYHYCRGGAASAEPVLTEVRPGRSSLATVAQIRQSLALGRFDEADDLCERAGGDALVDTPLVHFHPSQVAAARLRAVVATTATLDDETQATATLAAGLEQLAAQAATGHATAVASFAQACTMIPNQLLGERPDRQCQMVNLVLQCLARVLACLATSPDTVLAAASLRLQALETTLQDRGRALQFVVSMSDGNAVSPRLTRIRSTPDLLEGLLAGEKYGLVQTLWEQRQGHLAIDVVLEQLVRLAPTVDPAGYLFLLQDLVLPQLTIHHELLPILRAWACETADGLDDNGIGLAAAVSLLEVRILVVVVMLGGGVQ
jgi:hypothetical protein